MKKLLYPFTGILLFCLVACENSNSRSELKTNSQAGYRDGAFDMAGKPGDVGGDGVERKFIRTAELKFRVDDVVKSTTAIEQITASNGGFVTYTNLASVVNNVVTTPVSSDSTLETTYYTVSNAIVLRVPSQKLDTALYAIAKLVDFLDYRTINAEDVALQILANELTRKRAAVSANSEVKATAGLADIKIEESMAHNYNIGKKEERQARADEARLANLSLSDRISYSTISLDIYQRSCIRRTLIANDKNIEAYEPGFGSKLASELGHGLRMIESLILVFVKLWALWLLIFAAYVVYKRTGKTRENK